MGIILLLLVTVSSAAAMTIDLSDVRYEFGTPVVLSECIDSSIGCSRIIADPIERSLTTSIEAVNESHEAWTAEVTVSTSFSGMYRNVPLAIEVPKTARLNAGGNTPYAIKTEGDRRFIMLRIAELDEERTVKITVLKDRERTLWDRISAVLSSF